MSISSTANRVAYTGNGVTTAFSFPYEYFASTDLVVLETVIATGAYTTKALTTDYTVSGTPDASGIYPNGGTVTALVAPASTVKWTIYRDPSPTQTTVFVDNDKLPAASINNGLDKLTIICQRVKELILRAARLADGDISGADVTLPTPVASKLLGWASNGLSLVNYAIADLSSSIVTAFSATMLASASKGGWRVLLGIDAAASLVTAATTNIGAAGSDCIDISGVVTITAFDNVASGIRRQCRVTQAGGFTIAHSGTLICPGSVNLVLGQFDQFEAESYGSGTWVIINVMRSTGEPIMGWATKSTQQTGTDAIRSVTAAQQQNHPSATKAFGLISAGAAAVVGAYPASASVAKNGTGDYTVAFGQTMANTNYGVTLAVHDSANLTATIASRTTTQLQILIRGAATGTATDAAVSYDIKGQLA